MTMIGNLRPNKSVSASMGVTPARVVRAVITIYHSHSRATRRPPMKRSISRSGCQTVITSRMLFIFKTLQKVLLLCMTTATKSIWLVIGTGEEEYLDNGSGLPRCDPWELNYPAVGISGGLRSNSVLVVIGKPPLRRNRTVTTNGDLTFARWEQMGTSFTAGNKAFTIIFFLSPTC